MATRITIILSVLAVAGVHVNGDVVPSSQPGSTAQPVPPPTGGAPEPASEIVASRLLTGPVDSQIAALRLRMSINLNDKGPFGLFQDPKRAAEQVIDIPIKKEKMVRKPLRDIVQAIPISMVIPSTQEFLVNSRTIRIGNQFPIVVGNQTIQVRVEKVRSSGVVFRDIQTGEVAEKRMEFLPEGIIRSNGGEVLPDGIIPTGRSSTEELVLDPTKVNPNNNGGSR